jgi:hypothetical protein
LTQCPGGITGKPHPVGRQFLDRLDRHEFRAGLADQVDEERQDELDPIGAGPIAQTCSRS